MGFYGISHLQYIQQSYFPNNINLASLPRQTNIIQAYERGTPNFTEFFTNTDVAILSFGDNSVANGEMLNGNDLTLATTN